MRRSTSYSFVIAGVLFAALVCQSMPAAAQMAGIVRGTVVDAAGKPVEGARVTFVFEGGLTRSYETKTDARGTYAQIGLAPGPYTVTAAKEGVGTRAAPVTLKPGDRITVNFDLTPLPADPKAAPGSAAFEAGVAASKAGRNDEAVAKFQEALQADPKCFDCQYNLGLVYAALKQYDDAERALKAAQALKPDAPEPLEGLTAVYNSTRRFDEAATASEAAIKLRGGAGGGTGGGNASTVFDQGLVLWNAGKIDEALARFRETLQLDPNHGEAHYWLGMGHLNQGRMAEAAEELETYLKREPNGRFADQAKGLLPQIKKP